MIVVGGEVVDSGWSAAAGLAASGWALYVAVEDGRPGQNIEYRPEGDTMGVRPSERELLRRLEYTMPCRRPESIRDALRAACYTFFDTGSEDEMLRIFVEALEEDE